MGTWYFCKRCTPRIGEALRSRNTTVDYDCSHFQTFKRLLNGKHCTLREEQSPSPPHSRCVASGRLGLPSLLHLGQATVSAWHTSVLHEALAALGPVYSSLATVHRQFSHQPRAKWDHTGWQHPHTLRVTGGESFQSEVRIRAGGSLMAARPKWGYKFWICLGAVLIFTQKLITWSTLQAYKTNQI